MNLEFIIKSVTGLGQPGSGYTASSATTNQGGSANQYEGSSLNVNSNGASLIQYAGSAANGGSK